MSDQGVPQTAPDEPAEGMGPVDPFEWLHAHPWPPKRPTEPRPVLTPEEFSEAPLSLEDRRRQAELLAKVRDANHHLRR
ncbi:hypothetical protein [Kitasatospora cathayae]|uniref:Uncharacterized protein n=1 Tax=Kitasatospora cathayae TaxID=3004092 RepID=A0ABY7Q4W7_9ACTN|nr:hypothetical protein [Kitasatospora sp. HUAS 3-15]WBP87710.1 hypothetical protein O1G21_18915 [Kitasatospora sp. HUAS 3-15]